MFLRSHALLPTAGLLLAAVISGLTWLPLHAIERNGIAGLWVALAVVAVACVPLAPGLAGFRDLTRRDLVGLFWIAALIGVAWAFYTASLTTTEVARAILLFYIAPVWGTLLEVFVLRQPLTLRRATALGLGSAGLIAILGIGLDLRFVMNLGDVLALMSGMLWSVGLLFVFRRTGPTLATQSAALAVGALIGAVTMVLLLERAPPPSADAIIAAGPWILVAGLGFVLPLWLLSLWAARSVSPARATLIFMAEVCVGVGSAALWAGQPFGARETIGTILVLAAAAVEFGGTQKAASLSPQGVPPL
ncbi:DMT family transporter [Dongia deserti]|uniref:DMT family transporter n=1 Tax=Dongia deserti TaxID=2268030 RepID=UPI0013C4006B|nr:DMT family transporter [Dongia deserti]